MMDLRGNRFVRQDSPAFRLRDGGAFDDANLVAHLELVMQVRPRMPGAERAVAAVLDRSVVDAVLRIVDADGAEEVVAG